MSEMDNIFTKESYMPIRKYSLMLTYLHHIGAMFRSCFENFYIFYYIYMNRTCKILFYGYFGLVWRSIATWGATWDPWSCWKKGLFMFSPLVEIYIYISLPRRHYATKMNYHEDERVRNHANMACGHGGLERKSKTTFNRFYNLNQVRKDNFVRCVQFYWSAQL